MSDEPNKVPQKPRRIWRGIVLWLALWLSVAVITFIGRSPNALPDETLENLALSSVFGILVGSLIFLCLFLFVRWAGRRGIIIWLALSVVAVVVIYLIAANTDNPPNDISGYLGVLLTGFMAGTGLIWLWLFLRWLCCWRQLKRMLLNLVVMAVMVLVFYAVEDWRGWHAWNRFKKEWEAKGERFDRQSVIPPPVPDGQNFALSPLVYSSYGQILTRDGKEIPYEKRDINWVNRLKLDDYFGADSQLWPTNESGSWAKGTITDLKVWQEFYRRAVNATNGILVPPQPQSPAADVLLALGKYDPIVEELRAAARLPVSRFPIEYEKEYPPAIYLPHMAPLKKCAQFLQLRAIAELENGQSDKALEDVKLSLRLAESVRNEPCLISHLVRIAIFQITLQPIYEGLAGHRWSDAQLAALDSELARLDWVADYQRAMRGEMISFQIGTIEYMRRHTKEFIRIYGDLFSENDYTDYASFRYQVVSLIGYLIPQGWFYQNELRCARAMETYYLPAADVKQKIFTPGTVRNGDAAVEVELSHRNPYNIIVGQLSPALGSTARKFAYAQAATDLARTAIALERYRLARGEYPESLEALAPQFIAQVPHDVIGGQPLKYRRAAEGKFTLYSVGWNETDDGGTVVLKNGTTSSVDIAKGDWVWRYPVR